MEISFGRLGGAPVGRRRKRREAGRRKAAGRAWVLAPASGNGFSKIFRQSNIRRTQPPAIRHPGSLRAFGDIHVTKLLFFERNIKKISFPFTKQRKSSHRLSRPPASTLFLASCTFPATPQSFKTEWISTSGPRANRERMQLPSCNFPAAVLYYTSLKTANIMSVYRLRERHGYYL